MDHHAPRPPGGGASRKRKVREGDTSSSSNDDTAADTGNNNNGDDRHVEAEPGSDNKILAGYLAYEFLRKGTLLGESPPSEAENLGSMGRRSFEQVASILKVDGVHIPGIFNPSQLPRWIGHVESSDWITRHLR